MKKFYLLLFVIASVFTLGRANAATIVTGTIKVVPGTLTGWSSLPKEKAKLVESFKIIEAVLNSDSFKMAVLNHTAFTSNKGLTNSQIYATLMEGKELLSKETPGEMNFNVKRYYRWWSKVIGYTNMGSSQTIYVNGRFYKNYSAALMASNITHEWIHLMGFSHDSAADSQSVPYAVGDIMGTLAKQYVTNGYID